MKPGWQTTEFYLTILSTVLVVLVGAGVVGQAEADQISDLGGSLIAAVIPVVVYIVGRSWVKRSAS